MKKVFMTVVAVMAVSVSMVAAPKAEKNAEPTKYSIDFNSRSIARYLSMSNDQVADMERVHDNFSREMKKAEQADDANREKLTKKAVLRDISYMRVILSETQFNKYRTVLNATLHNRGLNF
jgi:hypothetical protein